MASNTNTQLIAASIQAFLMAGVNQIFSMLTYKTNTYDKPKVSEGFANYMLLHTIS